MSEEERIPQRPVRRGEGEVTQWPRALSAYVPSGPEDTPPAPDEDPVRHRLSLAARLVGLLAARGEETERFVRELWDGERLLRRSDRAGGAVRIERLIAEVDVRLSQPVGYRGGLKTGEAPG